MNESMNEWSEKQGSKEGRKEDAYDLICKVGQCKINIYNCDRIGTCVVGRTRRIGEGLPASVFFRDGASKGSRGSVVRQIDVLEKITTHNSQMKKRGNESIRCAGPPKDSRLISWTKLGEKKRKNKLIVFFIIFF